MARSYDRAFCVFAGMRAQGPSAPCLSGQGSLQRLLGSRIPLLDEERDAPCMQGIPTKRREGAQLKSESAGRFAEIGETTHKGVRCVGQSLVERAVADLQAVIQHDHSV